MPGTEARVCLLTGAGGTLGRAFCRSFAGRYRIAAVYRASPPDVPTQRRRYVDPLAPAAAAGEDGPAVFAIRADLEDERQLARVVELTLARFDRIDLLVNAAVRYGPGPVVEKNGGLDDVARLFHLNAVVPLKLSALAAQMFWRDRDRENRAHNRSVVNVSSISGVNVYPHVGQGVYSATKSALNMLTCHMAAEFRAFNVRVNAVAPTTFPGVLTPEEVARAVVHLDEETMNGKILVMDRDESYYLGD
jgi:NAD(P)-dependent dehydrogenase (short-subunit alcohol dehydrogenase family)